ncbi:terminase large subunit domain-containing protein [Mycolicibacterium obuense]|uniref:terminase large subunit domain-containing protein n=1 Tax=Mycolicibacterium obuense TaxID=1807 RepID=UPI0023508586|nr:terminase large subunit [Mycolicibacterium obuense]
MRSWSARARPPGVRQAVLQCPRGQGKSTLLAALAVWATFDINPTGEPQVPIMATTVSQAQRAVYDVACKMVAAEPQLDERSIAYTAIANARIVVGYNGGQCYPIASDVDGLQGLDPTLAIVDEIGFQPLESLTAMVLASGKRARSLVVGVGTPGLDRERSALWHLRSAYLDGRTPPGFSFTEYSAPDDRDVRDRSAWLQACPALDAGYQAIDALETAVEMSPESHFRIFHLGQWQDGVDNWLGSDGRKVWEALHYNYALREGAPTWVGIDVGLVRDSTAIVIGQRRLSGQLHATAKIWMPTPDGRLDVSDIMAFIRHLDRRYELVEIAFDPRLFELPSSSPTKESRWSSFRRR